MPRKTTHTPIEAIRHDERRANIPTEELRGFVADQESAPPSLLYPRDPSLDPQLVWKGKDDQDRDGLEVPVVPVYIQEKIHPEAIIEDFVREARKAQEGQIADESAYYQPNLFDDFNGLEAGDFSRKLDFYSHAEGSRPHWSNRMILGDSLLVMASLAEKEGLKGRVQMIYIDPPYGIKFGSNWQVSTRKRDVKDGSADHLTRQPEQVKAFRDTWQLGIHSYLTYLRDRLVVARDLLTETGSVFVQIGDENVHRVRCLMDEIFGDENFVGEIVVEKTAGLSMEYLDRVTDYLLWYAKDREHLKYRQLFSDKMSASRTGLRYYRFIEMEDGYKRPLAPEEIADVSVQAIGKVYSVDALTSQTQATTTRYKAEFQGKRFDSGKRQWATPPSGLARLIKAGRVQQRASSIGYVRFLDLYD